MSMNDEQKKVEWQGEVVSIQSRSTVWRYLIDNRTHRECGYPDYEYQMSGNAIAVRTLDLNCDYQKICRKLDAIAEQYLGDQAA